MYKKKSPLNNAIAPAKDRCIAADFLKKTPCYAEEVTPCAVFSMLWYWYLP